MRVSALGIFVIAGVGDACRRRGAGISPAPEGRRGNLPAEAEADLCAGQPGARAGGSRAAGVGSGAGGRGSAALPAHGGGGADCAPYGGEPDLSARAAQAGAHFSVIEENVAVGPSAGCDSRGVDALAGASRQPAEPRCGPCGRGGGGRARRAVCGGRLFAGRGAVERARRWRRGWRR